MPHILTPLKDRLVRLLHLRSTLGTVRGDQRVKDELASERPEDLAETIARMEPEDAAALLQAMDPMQAGNIMVELPTDSAREIAPELSDDVLASYLDILPMDDALELREDVGEERFDALLKVIPDEDANEIRRLLAYPEDSVGRLMTEHFFWAKPEMTIKEILSDLRKAGDEKYEQINDFYVVDDHRKLLGVTSLRRVLRVPQATLVSEIMQPDPVSVHAADDEESAARTMARYGFYALPVVDDNGILVGIFTGDDAQAILREAETEDVLAVGAVSGDAEPYYSLNPWSLYKRRFPWLVALFAAETLTGMVLRHYGQDTDVGVPQLMYFMPLILGAGGNSGSQVTTTITRALALDEVKTADWVGVMMKEVIVASMIGVSLGILGFARAYFGWNTGMDLSLVVGLALPVVVIWATLVGSVLPIGAKRLGIDPAVMSAPFISTFVDATGLIIYFEIARRILLP
ncbi:MAG: magnesium transporter [Fimbriimonadaceae bacterium]